MTSCERAILRRLYCVLVLCGALLLVAVAAFAMRSMKPLAQCPSITEGDFDPTKFLACVNRFIDMGHDKAFDTLREASSPKAWRTRRQMLEAERITLLCRALYAPAPGQLLRPPGLGCPAIPYKSMPLEQWPHMPLAFSQGVPFLLVSSYDLYGLAESSGQYLEYCETNGEFHSQPYPIPSKQEAKDALTSLFESERWRAIKWQDEGPSWSYRYKERDLQQMLIGQVERIQAAR